MYKQFRIISSEVLGKEIDILLKELGIEEYIIMTDIKGNWGDKIKHMNNHIWPGIDEVRIVIVPKTEAHILSEALKNLKSKIKESLMLRVIITNIEDII